jgi:hypothetical protein
VKEQLRQHATQFLEYTLRIRALEDQMNRLAADIDKERSARHAHIKIIGDSVGQNISKRVIPVERTDGSTGSYAVLVEFTGNGPIVRLMDLHELNEVRS